MGALSSTSLGNPSNNLTCERQSISVAAAFAFVVVLELQVASSAAEPVHVSVVAMATLDRHAWESRPSRNANAERARMTGSEKNDAFCNAARAGLAGLPAGPADFRLCQSPLLASACNAKGERLRVLRRPS